MTDPFNKTYETKIFTDFTNDPAAGLWQPVPYRLT